MKLLKIGEEKLKMKDKKSKTLIRQAQDGHIKKKKEEKLRELEQQVEELTDRWKRAVADYRNLEARALKEKQDWIQFSNQGLLLPLLEILDDLEKANFQTQNSGINLILEKFKKILKNNNVEEIKIGDEFDPRLMECVEMVEGNGKKIIVEQKGYLFNSRLLRPAKVKVAKERKKATSL